MSQSNPLQTLVNDQAVRKAEAQYRLAVLFTPYGFAPERADFDRMEAFIDNPYRAFPNPTENVKASLDRTVGNLTEANAVLQAFAAQGTEPTLTADQLFTTAHANVNGNRINTAAYQAAA
jgi:hypothetical protein